MLCHQCACLVYHTVLVTRQMQGIIGQTCVCEKKDQALDDAGTTEDSAAHLENIREPTIMNVPLLGDGSPTDCRHSDCCE